jgi:hypothetical protein
LVYIYPNKDSEVARLNGCFKETDFHKIRHANDAMDLKGVFGNYSLWTILSGAHAYQDLNFKNFDQ